MAAPRNPHLTTASKKKEISAAVKQKLRGGITQLINVDPSTDQLEKALKKASKILSGAVAKHFKKELKEEEESAEHSNPISKEEPTAETKTAASQDVKKAAPRKAVKKSPILPAPVKGNTKKSPGTKAARPIINPNKKEEPGTGS